MTIVGELIDAVNAVIGEVTEVTNVSIYMEPHGYANININGKDFYRGIRGRWHAE